MPDTEMPFIPEFRQAADRNRWIKEHATYFTTIMRRNRSYIRDEHQTLDDAEKLAKRMIENYPQYRVMIYAVFNQHDTLVATVHSEGVIYHD